MCPDCNCKARHHFSKAINRDEHSPGHSSIWVCKNCGYIFDPKMTDMHEDSYFGLMCSSWDPDVMKKSSIDSFEMSYPLYADLGEYDNFQIIYYSPRKLRGERTKSRAGDSFEFVLTDEEDRAIHTLLEETDFESWRPSVSSMLSYIRGNFGNHTKPGFQCTFTDQAYIYFVKFTREYSPRFTKYGERIMGEDYRCASPFIDLLIKICKNHDVLLPEYNGASEEDYSDSLSELLQQMIINQQ